MERAQAVITAAENLHATEFAIDQAYGSAAALAGSLVHIRRAAGLSPVVGQDALDEVTSALSALGGAQAAIVRAHAKLNVTKARIGCRTVATGGEDKGDQDFDPGVQRAGLRAVR